LLVEPVVIPGVDVVAEDPDQVAAGGHVVAKALGRIRIGGWQIDAEDHLVV